MKDFLINENTENLVLQNRSLCFTSSNSEYYAQKLKIILSMFKGEWYLNNQLGLPYFEEIFVKNPNLNRIQDLFKKEIINVDGIDTIETFNLEYDNIERELTVIFTARLKDGDLITVNI